MSTCHSVLWSLEDKQEWVLSFRQELNSVLWAWQQISYLLSQLAGLHSYLCSPSHLYGTSKHRWLVHFSPFGWGEIIFTHFRIICISSSRIYLFIQCVWFKLYVYICHLFKHLCTCVCNCVDTHVPAGTHGCVWLYVCVKLTLDVFFRVSLPSALRKSLLLNPDLLSSTRLASGLLWRFCVSAYNICWS